MIHAMLIDALLIIILIFTLLMVLTAISNLFFGAVSVPSNRATIQLMIKEAKLKKTDRVFDLGCGDGRLLFEAEKKHGTQGIGYENAPLTFLIAYLNKWVKGAKSEIRFRNFFKESLKEANAIFLYLSPEVQKKLAPKLKKECLPGTKIICNTFHLPIFTPEKIIPKNKINRTQTVHIYLVGANVAPSNRRSRLEPPPLAHVAR